MSEPSGANHASPASCDPDARIWMVEVDGNPYGPYSLNQITRYLAENRVRPQSSMSAPQWPGQKWTVTEIMAIRSSSTPPAAPGVTKVEAVIIPSPGRPSGTPPQMPERTTEITQTLNRPVLTEARPEDDPATGLFDVLQTVREHRPAPRITPSSPQVMGVSKATPKSGASWKQPQRLILLGAIGAVVIGSMAMMIHWLKISGSKLENVAAQNVPASPSGGKPVDPPAAAAHPAAIIPPPVSAVAAQAKPAFKPVPRLVLPAATQHTPVATPPQQHSAADNRGDNDRRDHRDARDARENDIRDANAARDPRDFRDNREQARDQTREQPDPRDPRDFRNRDPRNPGEFREEVAAPGPDPNNQGNPFSPPNGVNGQPLDDLNNQNRP